MSSLFPFQNVFSSSKTNEQTLDLSKGNMNVKTVKINRCEVLSNNRSCIICFHALVAITETDGLLRIFRKPTTAADERKSDWKVEHVAPSTFDCNETKVENKIFDNGKKQIADITNISETNSFENVSTIAVISVSEIEWCYLAYEEVQSQPGREVH